MVFWGDALIKTDDPGLFLNIIAVIIGLWPFLFLPMFIGSLCVAIFCGGRALDNTNNAALMALAVISAFLVNIIALIFMAGWYLFYGLMVGAFKTVETVGGAAAEASEYKVVGTLEDGTVISGNGFGLYRDDKGNEWKRSGNNFYR